MPTRIWASIDPVWRLLTIIVAIASASFYVFSQIYEIKARIARAGLDVTQTYSATLDTREMFVRYMLNDLDAAMKADPNNRYAASRRDELQAALLRIGQDRVTVQRRLEDMRRTAGQP